MTSIRWTSLAADDLERHLDYYAEHSEAAMERLAAKLKLAATTLSTFPHGGRRLRTVRKYPVPGTHLVMLYRANEEVVEIMAIPDSRENWQRRFLA